jgi:hypothetical protein
VTFLALVARTDSDQNLKRIDLSLTGQHKGRAAQLVYLDRIPLPNWAQEDCPWCAEYDLLCSASEQIAYPPLWLTRRLASLSNKEEGIVRECVFLLEGQSRRVLGKDSPVAPRQSGEVRIIFQVASALQSLRNARAPEKRLAPDYPDLNVLNATSLELMDEAMLRTIFLKAVKPREWGLQRREVTRRLMMDMSGASPMDQSFAWGEVLLGIGRGSVSARGIPEDLIANLKATGEWEKCLVETMLRLGLE